MTPMYASPGISELKQISLNSGFQLLQQANYLLRYILMQVGSINVLPSVKYRNNVQISRDMW